MGESFWTNFWTAASGFGGAVLGALIAFLFQNRSEKIKINEERKGIICKYSIFLDRLHVVSELLFNNYLKPQINEPLRHLNLPVIVAPFPEIDINDPAIELYFLAETNDVNIIAKLMTIKDAYIILLKMIEKRNDMHSNQFQEIASQNNIQSGSISKSQAEDILGRALYGKMLSTTDAIYLQIEYILSNYNDMKNEVKSIFTKIYPKAKMIEFFNINKGT